MPNWEEICLSKEDTEMCWDFSNKIIRGSNQFARMMKRDISESEKTFYKIKRTFVGKIGEIAFYRFLEQKNIEPGNLDEMFAIYEGQTNVDKYDFKTAEGETVDVKTAVFHNHSNLLVPIDQFNNMPKKYYVGVKTDIPSEISDYNQAFTTDCIKGVYICGFTTWETLEKSPTKNFGEFPCKSMPLCDLIGVEDLLKKFHSDC